MKATGVDFGAKGRKVEIPGGGNETGLPTATRANKSSGEEDRAGVEDAGKHGKNVEAASSGDDVAKAGDVKEAGSFSGGENKARMEGVKEATTSSGGEDCAEEEGARSRAGERRGLPFSFADVVHRGRLERWCAGCKEYAAFKLRPTDNVACCTWCCWNGNLKSQVFVHELAEPTKTLAVVDVGITTTFGHLRARVPGVGRRDALVVAGEWFFSDQDNELLSAAGVTSGSSVAIRRGGLRGGGGDNKKKTTKAKAKKKPKVVWKPVATANTYRPKILARPKATTEDTKKVTAVKNAEDKD
jgi:hypothetical protein